MTLRLRLGSQSLGQIGVVIGLLQIPLIFVMLGKGGLQTLTGVSWLAWILSGTLTSLIILGFGTWMPARSIAGARALKKVLGFADFLKRVEKDHIERLETTPQLFEKYLPYAMALGVEKTWAQSFARITVPTPQWYRGGGSDFFPVELVNGISSKIPTKQGA